MEALQAMMFNWLQRLPRYGRVPDRSILGEVATKIQNMMADDAEIAFRPKLEISQGDERSDTLISRSFAVTCRADRSSLSPRVILNVSRFLEALESSESQLAAVQAAPYLAHSLVTKI